MIPVVLLAVLSADAINIGCFFYVGCPMLSAASIFIDAPYSEVNQGCKSGVAVRKKTVATNRRDHERRAALSLKRSTVESMEK